MKIKTRLVLNTWLSIGTALAVGLILFVAFQKGSEEQNKGHAIQQIVKDVIGLRAATFEYLVRHDARAHDQWKLKYETLPKQLDARQFTGAEEKSLLDAVSQEHQVILPIFKQLEAIAEREQKSGAGQEQPLHHEQSAEEILGEQLLLKTYAMFSAVMQLSELNHQNIVTAQRTVGRLIGVVIGLMVIIIAFSSGLTARSIMQPLEKLQKGVEIIGSGNLDYKVGMETKDEVGQLARTFDRMTENIKDSLNERKQTEENLLALIREIQEAVNILAASSSQILRLTSQLATSSAETATAIAETTTTMEEVKQTSRQMSQRAAVVSEVAQGTSRTSESGRRSVEETITGMGRIKGQMDVVAGNIVKLSEQSQAIGLIISTVNDLANQSNLLAVNASIEAAKAGEQGKGFAVVAQEVRSLATQSKEATTQVRTILGEIQKAISGAVMATDQGAKAVEAGLNQSQTAGDAIGRMAEDIVQAAQAALQISVATNEQVVGIDQVALAMENIKRAAGQIVSSTRESEESAKSLHELGMKLKEMVERYEGQGTEDRGQRSGISY